MNFNNLITILVSEQVMDWTRKMLPNNDNGLPYYADQWVDSTGEKMKPVNFWTPASNLDNAWLVKDLLRDKGYDFRLLQTKQGIYKATFYDEKETFESSEEKIAPLAICLAALKVFNIEVSEEYR